MLDLFLLCLTSSGSHSHIWISIFNSCSTVPLVVGTHLPAILLKPQRLDSSVLFANWSFQNPCLQKLVLWRKIKLVFGAGLRLDYIMKIALNASPRCCYLFISCKFTYFFKSKSSSKKSQELDPHWFQPLHWMAKSTLYTVVSPPSSVFSIGSINFVKFKFLI